MDSKGPQITWVEQPQTLEDELEEELFFLDMNMSCLKQTERAKTYFQEMESVRKKLIKMENNF